jgi:nucleotide-binding universal stress UspA family protein
MYKSIVVGTDFSETADRAVDQAVQVAKAFGARLYVITAYRSGLAGQVATSGLDATAAATSAARLLEEAESHIGREVEDKLTELTGRLKSEGVEVETMAVLGDPATVLLDTAEKVGADLIVVGNRGMSGITRFLMGSVSNTVSHHAPCSVLIAHTTD